MSNKEDLNELFDILRKVKSLNHVLGIAEFDNETIAPQKSADERNESFARVSSMVFDLTNSEKYKDIVKRLYKNRDQLSIYDKRLVEICFEDILRTENISAEDNYQYSLCTGEAFSKWLEAKEKGDFSIVAPYLEKEINYLIKFINARERKYSTSYSALLDDYEKGNNETKLDEFFGKLKLAIVPLLKSIQNASYQINDNFLSRKVAIKKQEPFSFYLLKTIGFDINSGVLSTVEHPFTTMLSKHDVRVTTHYFENNFISNLYSVVHEGGHGIYGQNEPDVFYKHFINDNQTSGMHECMSRFYENVIGRSKAFIHTIYPRFSKKYAKEFGDITEEQFYEGVNVGKASLIRTDADELTYSLHIIIRYELEKELINGKLAVKDLPAAWNKKYKELLGVEPKNDTEGVLQDVHWYQGMFGYFPSYALGNAYASQIFARMEKDFDVYATVANGQMKLIKNWLRDNAFNYGSLMNPDEWIIQVTGEPLNADYYINYLLEKYKKLYRL